jgi:chemotaxis protein CheD
MKLVTVKMADMKVSRDPEAVLVTYALGSCIGVLTYDPVKRVAGMIHYMLPAASLAVDKAVATPAMFADTGIPLLFEEMYRHSCRKQDLVVKVVGGANLYDDGGTFEIGKRNYIMLRKMFWKAGVSIAAEDVGGSSSRTARLFVSDGRALVRHPRGEVEL